MSRFPRLSLLEPRLVQQNADRGLKALQKRDWPRLEALRAYLTKQYHHHFPERQIYFRSRAVVRFVSLSPRFQSISLAVAFTVTCWVGIASATMIFGNQVIESKDRQIADLREIRGDLHKQLLTHVLEDVHPVSV